MRSVAGDLTVIVPALNAADTISSTIRSIHAQSVGAPAVIVVDDGSIDDTPTVARASGAHVITTDRQGPGAARNLGVEQADTGFIAFCDADDTWPVTRLEADLLVLTQESVRILLGRTRFDADSPDLLSGMALDADGAALIPHFGAATMTMSAFQQVGPIDEDLSNYEDYEWFLRARERSAGLTTHDRISLHRRMHRGSTSQTNRPTPRDLLAVLRTSVNRRAQAGSDPLPSLSALRREAGR